MKITDKAKEILVDALKAANNDARKAAETVRDGKNNGYYVGVKENDIDTAYNELMRYVCCESFKEQTKEITSE